MANYPRVPGANERIAGFIGHEDVLGLSDGLFMVEAVRDLARMAVALERALRDIADLKPLEYPFPADWSEQVASCPGCERYRGHPIQGGICHAHRRPLWDREKHDGHEVKRLGYRAKTIARDTLAELDELRGEVAPQGASQPASDPRDGRSEGLKDQAAQPNQTKRERGE